MGNSNGRVEFRSQLERLFNEVIPYEDAEFWNLILSRPLPLKEAFEVITPDDVRLLKTRHRVNTTTLFKRLLATLMAVAKEGSSTGKLSKSSETAALTCVRVITRIMPFMLENPGDEFVAALLWQPGSFVPPVQEEFKRRVSVEREKDAASRQDTVPAIEPLASSDAEPIDFSQVVVGFELMALLQRLLFLQGFSVIAPASDPDLSGSLPRQTLQPQLVWKGGIGTVKDLRVSATRAMVQNRTDVMRCLLATLSSPLFQKVDEYSASTDEFHRIATSGDLPFTANLFCSLFSTIFSCDPVGYGVPYGHVFSGKAYQDLTEASLHLSCVLLDFAPPLPGAVRGKSTDVTDPAQSSLSESRLGSKQEGGNVYRAMLDGIVGEDELQMVVDGFLRILKTAPASRNTYLPRSVSAAPFCQESVLLLWYCMTYNQRLVKRLASHEEDSTSLLIPILFLLLDASQPQKGVPSRSSGSVVYMCAFVLLVLSSEREFAVRLNFAYNDKFPLDIPLFQGSFADLLTIVLHRVIVLHPNSSDDSLVDMLVTTLSNVSPYVKSFCLEASVKILSLIDRVSRPRWLLGGPYRYQVLSMLIDLVNNSLQYQYEGNQRLAYSILRQKELFFELKNLSFPSQLVKEVSPRVASEDEIAPVPAEEASDAGLVPRLSPPAPSMQGREVEAAGYPWRPTQEWFDDWKSRLTLHTVLRLIECLLPQVETMCQEKGLIDQADVLKYLRTTTMVGLLPVPHPIVVRSYQPNAATDVWITSFLWGVIFAKSQELPLFDWQTVRLVTIAPEDR